MILFHFKKRRVSFFSNNFKFLKIKNHDGLLLNNRLPVSDIILVNICHRDNLSLTNDWNLIETIDLIWNASKFITFMLNIMPGMVNIMLDGEFDWRKVYIGDSMNI